MGGRTETFRASAGVVVLGRHGLVLAFERHDVEGAFQLPQGGIEPGETPLQAARRELSEESGIPLRVVKTKFDVLREHSDWLTYTLPHRRRELGLGQTQKWFLFGFAGLDPTLEKHIDLSESKEFKTYKWMTLDQLIYEVIWWRKPIYRRLREEFGRYCS